MLTALIIGLIILGIIGVVRIIVLGVYLMLPVFVILFIGAFIFNPWAVVILFIIFMAIIDKKQGGSFWFGNLKRRKQTWM